MKLIISTLDNTSITGGIRSAQANVYGNYDPQIAQEVAPAGVDACPPALSKPVKVVYGPSVKNGTYLSLGVINKNQKAAPGEVRLYSQDSTGAEQAKIWVHNTGKVEIGGTSDSVNANHAVQYEGLETAFNQLKTDFDTLVTNYNAHVHVLSLTSGTGTAAPTATTGSNTTADITGAKEEDILFP